MEKFLVVFVSFNFGFWFGVLVSHHYYKEKDSGGWKKITKVECPL